MSLRQVKRDALSRLVDETPEMASYVNYLRKTPDDPSLAHGFVRSAARHLLFEKALADVDDAFREAGIDFLVLKGMALGYLVYPDPATRPMTDIDLLVRPRDVGRAAKRLEGLGYQPLEHHQGFTEELVRFGGELSFGRTPGPFLDLHWLLEQYERLRGLIRIDEEALWQRAMSYTMGGRRLKTPSLEDQVLTLSIHLGLVHRMKGLRWLLDIDLLIRTFSDEIDWPVAMQRARQWGIDGLVRHTVWLSRETFDTPVPPAIPRPLRGSRTPLGPLVLLDRWRDRFQVIRRVLFPSRDWLRFRYRLERPHAVWLYRVYHPLLVLTGRFE